MDFVGVVRNELDVVGNIKQESCVVEQGRVAAAHPGAPPP